MIKVIVFDYAGVISPGPMTSWSKDNVKTNNQEYIYYKDCSIKMDLGLLNAEEINQILAKFTRISKNDIWEKIYLKPQLNKNIVDLIVKLKTNYKIILFSNFYAPFLRNLLEKENITKLFDQIIISSEYGLRKPDPKFYDLLVIKSGVEKDEILFTDDDYENVAAGNNFGIKTIQFTNTQKFIKDIILEGVKI